MPGCVFDAQSVLTGPQSPAVNPLCIPLMSKGLSLWGKMDYCFHTQEEKENETYSVNRQQRLTLQDSYKRWFPNCSSSRFPGLFDDCKKEKVNSTDHLTTYFYHQNNQQAPVVRDGAPKINPVDGKCIRRRPQHVRSPQEDYFSLTSIRCRKTMVNRKCQNNKLAEIYHKSPSTPPYRSSKSLPTIQTGAGYWQSHWLDEKPSAPRPSRSHNTTFQSNCNHTFSRRRLEFIRLSRRSHFWNIRRPKTRPTHSILSPPPLGPFTLEKPTTDAPTISPTVGSLNLPQLLGGKAPAARVECPCRSCRLRLAHDEIRACRKCHEGLQ